jgi:hypothetical protein
MPVQDVLGSRCQRWDHHLLEGPVAVAGSQAHQARIAQNGVQPPPNRFGVTQRAELYQGDNARLLNRVEGVVAVAQEPDGGGVQGRPVPLQERGERFHPTGAGEGGQLGITGWQGPHTERMPRTAGRFTNFSLACASML